MGFAASSGMVVMLMGRKTDIELQIQQKHQIRMYFQELGSRIGIRLSQQMSQAIQSGDRNAEAALQPGGAAYNQMNAALMWIASIDKQLEQEIQKLDIQRQAIVTQIESVRKQISKNIQMSFALGATG